MLLRIYGIHVILGILSLCQKTDDDEVLRTFHLFSTIKITVKIHGECLIEFFFHKWPQRNIDP